jgi:hypothetical protein
VAGDDPGAAGDFMTIDLSNNNGTSYGTVLYTSGDVAVAPNWTKYSAPIPAGYFVTQMRIRLRVQDGLAVGDVEEGGIDDVRVYSSASCSTGSVCNVPTGLNAPTPADANACTSTGITVSWTVPATWGDTSGSRTWTVLRDGVAVASGPCSGALTEATLSCVDSPGDALAHTYAVKANNGCGSSTTSAASGSASDGADVTAPASPSHNLAKATPNINFSWLSVPTAANYDTYSSATPNPVTWTSRNTTATLAWADPTDLGDANTYFYTTTALDACLNESAK